MASGWGEMERRRRSRRARRKPVARRPAISRRRSSSVMDVGSRVESMGDSVTTSAPQRPCLRDRSLRGGTRMDHFILDTYAVDLIVVRKGPPWQNILLTKARLFAECKRKRSHFVSTRVGFQGSDRERYSFQRELCD